MKFQSQFHKLREAAIKAAPASAGRKKAERKQSLRDLLRWTFLLPLILLLLFGCGTLGTFGLRAAQADTRSALSADYSPWPFTVIMPINPEIIEEVKEDQLLYPSSFALPVEPTIVTADFWLTATPTPSPTPTITSTPTITNTPTITTTAGTPTSTITSTPMASPSASPTPTFTPSGPPSPIPPAIPPANTYWFYDDTLPLSHMMYTTIPNGNYRSGGSVSFYSPTFLSGQSLNAGTTSVSFYGWNPSPSASLFSAELLAGGTSLGSGTFALPGNTYDAYLFSASFSTGSYNFADGERLEVRFNFSAPGEIYWDDVYNYSGVRVPSVATTPTPTASPTASPTVSPTPTNTLLPTATDTPPALPADPTTSLISAAPASITANGVSTSTITVQLRDALNNPLTSGGDTVTVGTTLGSLSGVTDNGDGTYTATLTSAITSGTATITGSVNAAAITDNATVDFTPGPADATNSLISAAPTSITADGLSNSTITVQLKDANDNNLTSGGDAVILATTLGSLGPVTDNLDGTYAATLTSAITTGTATITGTVNAAVITDTAVVNFVPGPADAATSLITAAPTSLVADGVSISTITVQLRDANNNNLTSGGDTVSLATTLGSLSPVTDNLDGTYTATLTSATTTGTATITGTVNAAAITDTAVVNFVSGAADPTTSLITAAPTSVTADGVSTSTITVQLRDGLNNNLTSGGDTVTVATTLGSLSGVTDNGDGSYTATLTSATTTGTATITGTVNAAAITDTAAVNFVPGPADATTSLISAAPTSITANGVSTSSITVQLRDANNNNLTSGGDTVTLATTLGSLSIVTDNGDGTYTATLTSTTSGTATITGTVNAAAITDTAVVNFVPGPADPLTSLISAAPTSITANGIGTSTITVQLRDANSNNLTSGGDTVTLATTLGSLSAVTDNGDGTYTATLTSASTSGTATVSGMVNAAAITDTAVVNFVPGPADATTSLITAAPTSIVADGVSTSTITVQLRDANSNNLTSGGDTVTLATTLGSLSAVTDSGDGTYTATLTSAVTPGTATITGTVNATAITDNATVDFTAPASPDLHQIHYRWRNDDGVETAGPSASQVSATTNDTTSSLTDVVVSGMSITPGAGDYHVWFSGSLESSVASFQHVSLYLNGVQVAHTERQIRTEGSIPNTSFPVALHAKLTGVTAGQAIDVRWRTSTGPATMHERTLVLVPINPSDSTQVTATTDDTTLSLTDVAVSGMSITPGAGDYHVWFSGSVEGSVASFQRVSLYLNGSQIAHTEREIRTEGSIPSTSFPVALHARLTGVTAGQAIDVRWRTTAGTATMHERTLVVSQIVPADSTQVSATTDDTTLSTSDVLVSGMTITPGEGDYLVWFSGSVESSATSIQNVSLYVNGAQIGHTERQITTEGSIPNTSFPVATHAYVTGLGAGQPIDVRWRTSAGTASMHARTLVVEETPAGTATLAAAEDTALSGLATSTTKRIRFEVSNEGTLSSSGITYQLQVAETATCSSGTYTAVPTDTSGHWQIGNSIYITDGEATSNIVPGLFDEASTFVPGELKDAGNTTSSITLAPDEFTEIEFAVQATGNSTPGGNYCFRLYDSTAASPLDAYGVFAQASVANPPDPTTSLITAAPTSITADGSSTTTITVQLKDAASINLTSGGDTVTLATTLGSLSAVTDNGDGTYTATLTSATTTGTATVTGTVNAAAITDTAVVTFTPGPADATTSLISAAPTSIIANGVSTSTITVQLRDVNSNNLTSGGDTVTLATTLGSLSAVTDNLNGTYTATLTSAITSGTATVTGTVNASAITDTATVTFTPGPADATTSLISAAPTSIVADGVSTSTITVQLRDANSNNLTSGGDTVTLATTLGSLSAVTDNLDGTYTATLTSAVTPGTATITGTVNAAAITDNATVDFTPEGSGKMYWVDRGAGKIQRSNLDGTGVEDLIIGLTSPDGIDLDTTGGKMYWTEQGVTPKVRRANLDGSGVEDLVTGLSSPESVAVDSAGGKMYWTDSGTDKIQRANLDGTSVEDLITTGLSEPEDIELDTAAGKMYWVDALTREIRRANLNGSSNEQLFFDTNPLATPNGLALDLTAGKMYWVDDTANSIQRANLDGSVIENVTPTGVDNPKDIELDVTAGKMYWTESGLAGERIRRANLDGSSPEDLVTGLGNVRGIELDP